jgi:hypothetical protein
MTAKELADHIAEFLRDNGSNPKVVKMAGDLRALQRQLAMIGGVQEKDKQPTPGRKAAMPPGLRNAQPGAAQFPPRRANA